MAEASQFTFSLKEVTKALIKEQRLHEGKWVIALEFGLGAGLFGPEPNELRPSALVAVQKVLLARHPEKAPLHGLVVDAAEVNPANTTPRS
jgi:hypothetical protein